MPRRALAFAGALAMLFVALTGPLGDLAGTFLFSAHMAQHLVLTMVVPPLLLVAMPPWLLRPLLRGHTGRFAAVLTRAVVAFVVSAAVLVVWHVPLFYNAAVAMPALHAVMHTSLVGSWLLGWWPLMSQLPELPRLHYGARLLYLFLLGAPMVAVSAFVALANDPLFPHYAAAPRLWGLSPLEDQRLGGVLMWTLSHIGFAIPFSVIFFQWARAEADGDEPAADAAGR